MAFSERTVVSFVDFTATNFCSQKKGERNWPNNGLDHEKLCKLGHMFQGTAALLTFSLTNIDPVKGNRSYFFLCGYFNGSDESR